MSKCAESAQRGNRIGKKIDLDRSWLGKKMGRLEVYTPQVWHEFYTRVANTESDDDGLAM